MSYDVALEVPPFRVVGTVFLFPGSEPERLLDRATEMFVPVTDAVAYYGEEQITGTKSRYVPGQPALPAAGRPGRPRTGEAHQRLPGT